MCAVQDHPPEVFRFDEVSTCNKINFFVLVYSGYSFRGASMLTDKLPDDYH